MATNNDFLEDLPDSPVAPRARGAVSPYMNFDPSLFTQSEDQFIFPEGATHRRGRFEHAFSQIGGSVLLGALFGGTNGFLTGVRDTNVSKLVGSIRRTQVLNYVTKQGASSAQVLGVIALLYSGIGVILSKTRDKEDAMNTFVAAGSTGMLYKSIGGLRSSLLGGAVGLGLASVWYVVGTSDKLRQVMIKSRV